MATTFFAIVSVFAAAYTVDPIEDAVAAKDAALDSEWRQVSSRQEFDGMASAFRDNFRLASGYCGIKRTPLNAKSHGTKNYGAFRIEKVIIESSPGAFVPLLVFLPDEKRFAPPYAGFVFLPGHAQEGKGYAAYLHTCELGAKNGLASVIFDPLGQGERSQGAGISNADEHVRIGAYAALLGETTATYMIRDASRVLDYFASRPDIDPARLGVSGNSGGGTISAFMMAVEDRIKAATPSCYLSSAREHLKTCGPQDAEQTFFGGQSWGFNHASLVLGAGCPVLINAAVEDFFQIDGSRSTYGVVKDVAAKVGLPDGWYALSEAPGKHGMSKTHREQAVRFLLKHLSGRTVDVAEGETTVFGKDDVTVTPEGEVSRLIGFRSVYDEIADSFAAHGVSVEQEAKNARTLVLKEKAGAEAKDVLAMLSGAVEKGRRATLRIGGKARNGEATAVLFAEGPRYVMKHGRKGKLSYYESRKTDEVVAVDLYIAGRSLVALRAAELLLLADELKRRTGVKPSLVAVGRFATVAKFATAADSTAFAEIKFENEPKTFAESLKSRDYLSFADSGAMYSGRKENGSCRYVTKEGDLWQADWSWSETEPVLTSMHKPELIAWNAAGKIVFRRDVGKGQQRCYDPHDPTVLKWRSYIHVGGIPSVGGSAMRSLSTIALPKEAVGFKLGIVHYGDGAQIGNVSCTAVRLGKPPAPVKQNYPQIDESGSRILSDGELDGFLAATPRLTPELRRNGDRVDLVVNGKSVVPRIYKSSNRFNRNTLPAISVHSQDGFNIFTVSFRLDDARIPIDKETAGIWRPDGSCDFAKVRRHLRNILRRNPGAMLMIGLIVDPPMGWGERNPSELFRNEKGQFGVFKGCRVVDFKDRCEFDHSKDERPAVSYASERFAAEASNFLEHLFAGLEEMPESKSVIGAYVCGGTDTQWLDLFNNRVRVEQGADYSDVMKRRFAEFRKKKYASNDVDVTIPPASAFWDAKRQFLSEGGSTVISDYREFVAKSTTQLRLELGKAVKRGSKGRLLVGSYSPAGGLEGYPLISASYSKGLLESPDYDFFAVVPNYLREHVDPVIASVYDGSCIRRGKLYIGEMDLRTSEVQHWSIWGSEFWRSNHTPETFMRKTLYFVANALTHGGSFHAYDLNGGWFAAEGARKAWRKANELAGYARAIPLAKERIALVGGERFYDFQSLKKERCLAYLLREQPRTALAFSGVPWNQYLLDDLLEMDDAELPKVVIFTDLSTVTHAQYMEIRSRWLKDGRVVVWMWRPGVFAEDGAKIEKDLGIALNAKMYGKRAFADGSSNDALMRGIKGTVMPSYPSYHYSNAPVCEALPSCGWEALAPFEDADVPALSVRRTGDCTEIYTSAPGGITPQLCRNMAREAGFAPIVESDDISGFGSGIFYLLAQSDGVKRIRIPEGMRLVKVFCGPEYEEKDGCFEVSMKRGDLSIAIIDRKGTEQ